MLDATDLSQITVDQFYGIEIGEFPVRIAETALWMMDHIMNNRLSLAFGRSYVRIPLEGSPHILNADALETDWTALLPPEECSYVFGNPPFAGAKFQSEEQRAQVRRIAALGKTGGTLDYVTAWFIKAGEYVQTGRARIGFVATKLDHAGRAGGATLADPVHASQSGNRLRAPHLRLGLRCAWQGPCACGHHRGSMTWRTRRRTSACSAIPTSRVSRKKRFMLRYRPICSMLAGLPIRI